VIRLKNMRQFILLILLAGLLSPGSIQAAAISEACSVASPCDSGLECFGGFCVDVCGACEQDTALANCGPELICMGDTVNDDKLQGLCQKTTGISICNPLTTAKFTDVVDRILNILFFVAIAVAPVMIIVAGFRFLTGGGNPETLQGARQMLIWTAVGFGIILLSKGIVFIVRGIIGF